ncbi:MAG: nucleotidyltransferase domain-containing protein [Clostridia bacterium]|nr:nucleotidyltransferase domain-containing protein [Clostridia bacterium]
MELKELRRASGMTQKACAEYLGIPLRTYVSYENDESKSDTLKYRYMLEKLSRRSQIDEEHGILTPEQIKKRCAAVFAAYPVNYCYLFGSYAKNRAKEESDVDLLVSTPLTGLAFFELAESLRDALGKKVDVLNQEQLKNNLTLTEEILKDGQKIYG